LLNAAPSGIDIGLVRSQHYANLSQDFLPLEKRRPDIPILKEAKAEYAKLK
jgi:hypothetical protein